MYTNTQNPQFFNSLMYRYSHQRTSSTVLCSVQLAGELVSVPCFMNSRTLWPEAAQSGAPLSLCGDRTFWRTSYELQKVRYTPYAMLLAATRRYRYSTYSSAAHHGTGSSQIIAYKPLYRRCRKILSTRAYDSSKTGSTHNLDIQYSTLLEDWVEVSRTVCAEWESLSLHNTPEMLELFHEFNICADEWFSAWQRHLDKGRFKPMFNERHDISVPASNWPALFMAASKSAPASILDESAQKDDEEKAEGAEVTTGAPITSVVPQILPPASASEYIKGPAKRFNVTAEARLEFVLTYAADTATLERCVRILHLDEVQDRGVEITVPKDSNCVRVDVTIRQFVDASEATGSSRLDTVSRAEACVDRIDGQIRGLLEALSRLDYAGVLGLPSFD